LVIEGTAPLQTARVQLSVLASCNLPAIAVFQKPIISQSNSWHRACDEILAHESIFRSNPMADVILVLITVVFFIIAWLYVKGCDRL
jgi:hypothetical protein